jgi:hypothetical protein
VRHRLFEDQLSPHLRASIAPASTAPIHADVSTWGIVTEVPECNVAVPALKRRTLPGRSMISVAT